MPALHELAPIEAELQEIRQQLHRRPELAYQEFQTSDLVARCLEKWGWSVTRHVGKTGVVGTLKVGEGARSIGLRADMDALPIQEESGLSYASCQPGIMHACGHDGHTTMLLGAAWHLVQTRRFSGTVHLYFQPAEEVGQNSGAQLMIADGLFQRFPCDAVFGAHNHPGVEAGVFMFRAGPFMAASDQVTITIEGLGGHAARPHLTVDPVVVASSLVMALQTIVARNIDPLDPAVVTIGMLHAGTARNVIPKSAKLELSVRSFSPEVRQTLKARITDLATAHAQSYGAQARIHYVEGYPVVVNTNAETALAADVARELFGAEKVIFPAPQQMGGEDFAYMLQQRPGCFLRIGNGMNGHSLHDSRFDFNDRNLALGAAFWSGLVERFCR